MSIKSDLEAISRASFKITSLVREKQELMAQVEQLRTSIRLTAEKWQDVVELDATVATLNRFYNKTPAQCLAEVKAQAVEEALRMVYHEEDDHRGYYSYEALSAHANQLRQAAKEGV